MTRGNPILSPRTAHSTLRRVATGAPHLRALWETFA